MSDEPELADDDKPQRFNYQPKSDEEIKQLAQAFFRGRIFSDRHLMASGQDVSMLMSVFMPLGLCSNEQREQVAEIVGDHGMIYEYLEKATERGVNGFPAFMSMQLLSSDDGAKVIELYGKLMEAEREILGGVMLGTLVTLGCEHYGCHERHTFKVPTEERIDSIMQLLRKHAPGWGYEWNGVMGTGRKQVVKCPNHRG